VGRLPGGAVFRQRRSSGTSLQPMATNLVCWRARGLSRPAPFRWFC